MESYFKGKLNWRGDTMSIFYAYLAATEGWGQLKTTRAWDIKEFSTDPKFGIYSPT